METLIGFAVVYRWRLHPGGEAAFQEVWERNTQIIRDRNGGLGSRLHRGDDGIWYAYAQWPNREAWQRSPSSETWDPEGFRAMKAVIAERFPPILLDPIADYLVPGKLQAAASHHDLGDEHSSKGTP